jgi:DNA-directed RNA polymerase alpha subunit
MANRDHEILFIQRTIQHFDITRCKMIESWLSEYIRLLEVDEAIYKTNIQQLHLSTRALNVLQNNKITTIGQLLKCSADWDEIRKLRGAGEKVLHEIQEKLTQLQGVPLIS